MSGPAYTADPPAARRIVELDGLIALFHLPSGITHIVAPPAPQILDALARGPATAATLLRRLKRGFDLGEGDTDEALAARLDELERAGLVRRA
jgi:PqqD family protein of HPr-rel-A system